MREDSREAPDDTTYGTLSRWANRSGRYLLPTAGAVSLAVGLSLAVDRGAPWGAYAPSLLVILGIGSVASALAARSSRDVPSPEPVAPTGVPSVDSWVICPSCSARSLDESATQVRGSWRGTDVPRSPVASGAVGSGPTTPGDSLWAAWATGEGRLPVELIGPVPETANVPPRAGAPTLSEEGEPLLVAASPSTESSGEGPSATRGATSVLSTEPLAAIENPHARADATEVSSSWNGSTGTDAAPSVFASTLGDRVRQEALNPTPPHLRSRPESVESETVDGLQPRPDSRRGVRCVNCSDPVRDPADWRRCPGCHRSLCAGCMVAALVRDGSGWCGRCVELRELEDLPSALQPRIRPTEGGSDARRPTFSAGSPARAPVDVSASRSR